MWWCFYSGIIYRWNIFSIVVKAEVDIKDDAIYAALVWYAGYRWYFNCGRNSFLYFLYLTIFAKQFCILVCASECTAVLASVYLADVWGLCIIAASIWSMDQAGQQLTGQPLVTYVCRRGLSWWCFANVRGHMRPILPIFFWCLDHPGYKFCHWWPVLIGYWGSRMSELMCWF